MTFFGMLLLERGASTEVLPFRTRPIYVHIYFIRRPAAEYATQKPTLSCTCQNNTSWLCHNNDLHVRTLAQHAECLLNKLPEMLCAANSACAVCSLGTSSADVNNEVICLGSGCLQRRRAGDEKQ